ncbi:MAG: YqeG family HAD IIIA-type phosphatase [Oscillospiraceae bacterium]|nr:YqeG family HAD IIIA-type phosphatase [Oscillospiraceae bacterium]
MKLLPVPDLMCRSIYDIRPEALKARGARFVLLDIDNTVAPYTVDTAGPELLAWVEAMRGAGLALFILSNNRGGRPARFAAQLGLPYIKHARKPFPKKAREVISREGYRPGETAVVGDQIYTDALCARLCGAMAVTVRPIAFTNIWLRLRYWAEAPFRLAWYFIR